MKQENKIKEKGERIAKFLARSGVASRRESEKLISYGRIKLNGKILSTPAVKVSSKDVVLFDNQPVAPKQPLRLWRYHKPDGLITTHKDERNRSTVFDELPKELGRVISIGRLDLTSEGLLLLTNDGELARALELPSTGWQRKYRVRAYGKVNQHDLDKLQKGITIDGIKTGPIIAILERQKGDNVWISVTLREGKNREIRRALDTLRLRVNRLIRISYGPFQLGNLDKGTVEEVKLRILKEQVGHLIEIPDVKNVVENKISSNKKLPLNKGLHKPPLGNFKFNKRHPANRGKLSERSEKKSHSRVNTNNNRKKS